MSLFYLPAIRDGIHYFNDEESKHIARVLRMKMGDTLSITDGLGTFYQAKITNPDPRKCTIEVFEKREVRKKEHTIHIAIAPPKNSDRIEWFVEKAVEIGIDEVSFFYSQNSERKNINLERIEKIAVSALKQSQQAWLPKLNSLRTFKEVTSAMAEQRFIAYVDSANTAQLKSRALPKKGYLILIGPEGDFSKEELTMAIECGFEKVSLGANRLRTETAGLVACQTLQFVNT